MRRKLFTYTCFMLLGIVSAYAFLEKHRELPAILMTVFLVAVVRYCHAKVYITRRDVTYMLCFLVIGALCFAHSYTQINRTKDLYETYSGLTVEISGIVKNAKWKDYGYELRISPDRRDYGKMIIVYDYQGDSAQSKYAYSLIGHRVLVRGILKRPKMMSNPNTFNYDLYLKTQGVALCMSADKISLQKRDSIYQRLHNHLLSLRWKLEDEFSNNTEIHSLIKGMVFGDKSEIDDELRSEFNANGTGHILAVSGLHIGFLFALLKSLSRKRRTPAMFILISGIIFMYGEMSMWSPSTKRAVLVICINSASLWLCRRSDMLSSLSCAAIIILLNNPYELFGSGFQMSFLAMLGIVFFTKPLSILIGEYMAGLISVQLGVMPIGIFLFHRLNLLTVFINIPIVFLAGILVPACLICLFILLIMDRIPLVMHDFIEQGIRLIIEVNTRLYGDGFWSKETVGFSLTLLVLFYALLFFISSEWTRVMIIRKEHSKIVKSTLLIIAAVFIFNLCFFNQFSNDELVFIDVGQGDATHISYGRQDVLIDGGGAINTNIGERVLKPYLSSSGVKDVDLALVTHLHMDHYKGIEELSEVFPVKGVALSEAYRGSYRAESGKTIFLNKNSKLTLDDDCYIYPIWPISNKGLSKDASVKEASGKEFFDKGTSGKGVFAQSDENEFNMIYICVYKGIKIMLTGDLLEADELDMVKYYGNTDVLKCDVLKVAHHGSKSSSSEAFLDAVNPEIAVISVGEGNRYGHPSEETIEKLSERGVRIYRTDEHGAVGIDIRRRFFGRGYEIKVDTMIED